MQSELIRQMIDLRKMIRKMLHNFPDTCFSCHGSMLPSCPHCKTQTTRYDSRQPPRDLRDDFQPTRDFRPAFRPPGRFRPPVMLSRYRPFDTNMTQQQQQPADFSKGFTPEQASQLAEILKNSSLQQLQQPFLQQPFMQQPQPNNNMQLPSLNTFQNLGFTPFQNQQQPQNVQQPEPPVTQSKRKKGGRRRERSSSRSSSGSPRSRSSSPDPEQAEKNKAKRVPNVPTDTAQSRSLMKNYTERQKKKIAVKVADVISDVAPISRCMDESGQPIRTETLT